LYKVKKSGAKVGRVKNSQKEGMAFQRKVQKTHDKKVGAQSRQCLNSGALWFDPGDIITENDLIECKERKLTARGEKSFTITEEILNKIEEEAGGRRNPVVAFGFKGKEAVPSSNIENRLSGHRIFKNPVSSREHDRACLRSAGVNSADLKAVEPVYRANPSIPIHGSFQDNTRTDIVKQRRIQ
jgi:hypothetical protein